MTRTKRLSRAPAVLRQLRAFWRGLSNWRFRAQWPVPSQAQEAQPLQNPLRAYFDSHREGPGIWKWNHYFDIYHNHFRRFRDREVRVLEIGIYSGGSLGMWKNYFGPRCQVYGVDIEPACKAYESDFVKVFIGDQADRNFWKRFKQEVNAVDIVIDDGGHLPEQQIVTFEELLPHLRPGGVYLCEDLHGTLNTFASYICGFTVNLNASDQQENNVNDNERRFVFKTTSLQSAVRSVHFYPYVTVVERTDAPISELVAPKHGTQWQPFLK
ncbi:MAG TPA: class I SAM-dependent methyltransferase [Candidatus Acidoferrum sp.]|nr:class I SAM-dependent methyltransferase [Candidatus Acidoferrum sp.]